MIKKVVSTMLYLRMHSMISYLPSTDGHVYAITKKKIWHVGIVSGNNSHTCKRFWKIFKKSGNNMD